MAMAGYGRDVAGLGAYSPPVTVEEDAEADADLPTQPPAAEPGRRSPRRRATRRRARVGPGQPDAARAVARRGDPPRGLAARRRCPRPPCEDRWCGAPRRVCLILEKPPERRDHPPRGRRRRHVLGRVRPPLRGRRRRVLPRRAVARHAGAARGFPGASVLDVGGGHGRRPACSSRRVTGSRSWAAISRRRACASGRARGRAAFVAADFDLGIDGSFDVVLSYRLLPHARRFEDLVATLVRLARLGVVGGSPDAAQPERRGRRLLRPQEERRARHAAVPGSADAEIERAFAAHGLRPTARRGQRFFPMALHRATGSAVLARGLEAAASAAGSLASSDRRNHPEARAWLSRGTLRDWAKALFARSILKQRKLAEVALAAPPTACAASTSAPTTASSASCCVSAGARGRRDSTRKRRWRRSARWSGRTCAS